jgi:hypothetical protein
MDRVRLEINGDLVETGFVDSEETFRELLDEVGDGEPKDIWMGLIAGDGVVLVYLRIDDHAWALTPRAAHAVVTAFILGRIKLGTNEAVITHNGARRTGDPLHSVVSGLRQLIAQVQARSAGRTVH